MRRLVTSLALASAAFAAAGCWRSPSDVRSDGVSVFEDRFRVFFVYEDEDGYGCRGALLSWSGPEDDRSVVVDFSDSERVDVWAQTSEHGRHYVDVPFDLREGRSVRVEVAGSGVIGGFGR